MNAHQRRVAKRKLMQRFPLGAKVFCNYLRYVVPCVVAGHGASRVVVHHLGKKSGEFFVSPDRLTLVP
jgi:hypothetical protein